MSDAVPAIPRRKRSITRYLLLALVLIVGLFAWQLLGPAPAIRISPQTTYITAPLRPDGLPDYVAYQREKLSAGVTPENNAAVMMWRAFGPGTGSDEVSPEHWQLITRELQLPPARHAYLLDPDSDQITKPIEAWLTASDPAWRKALEDAPDSVEGEPLLEYPGYEIVFLAMDAPWQRDQLPPLADWIDANREPLDLLVEGSRRPRYYSPFAPPENNAQPSLVEMLQFDSISRSRAVARALKLRAMQHIGEGLYEFAWQDLHAMHRWARLVGQGATLVEQLVAVAMEGIAASGTKALLAEPLTPELARQIHADLLALGPASDMAGTFDEGERLFFLDAVVNGHQEGMGTFLANTSFLLQPVGDSLKALDYVAADWNVTLIKGNQIYDQLASACREPTSAARQSACQAFEQELYLLEQETHGFHNFALASISPAKRSNMLAASIIALLSPVFGASSEAEDRSRANLELLQLAAVLTVYRAKNGEYPDRLDQLVPDVIPSLPVDLYHAKPFLYQRDVEGYLLYSTGANGIDDGGSHEQLSIFQGQELPEHDEAAAENHRQKIPTGADDLSIRMPRPHFQLPTPPPTAETE